jgi:Fe-S cluster biogenesis protein NfuA
VANSREFQEKVRELGNRIGKFDQMPEGPAKTACKELIQLLMDVHGAGLDRIMEMIFESGVSGPAIAGQDIIARLGQDSIVGSLLLLYSLHPDDLEKRLHRAMDRMRPRLRKLACTADLIRFDDGMVQVQITASGHTCGSSAKDVKAMVEDGIYEFAPDVVSLEILGLEEPGANGFVALASLIGNASLVAAAANGHALQTDGAD